MRAVVAFLLLWGGKGTHAEGVDSCNKAGSCDECILNAGCVWVHCNNKGTQNTYMCLSSHLSHGCEVFIPENFPEFYPHNSWPVTILRNKEFSSKPAVQLRPQRIRVSARPGQRVHFNFSFKPAKDYPLDVYYLVDYSSSMSPFINNMKTQGKNIYKTLTTLTSNVAMGIGSFIEKPALPYSHAYKNSHTFKNIMSLADATTTNFTNILDSVALSGNFDNPEACLDALLQTMKCTDLIKWRKNTRHLILVTTDDMYHSAGDGKMAGAFRRHDGECHMIGNDYPANVSTVFDYPSVPLINHVASKNNFIIIFVVPDRVRKDYDELSKAITGSKVAKLTKSDFDVAKFIKEVYQRITQSFKFTAQNVPKEVKLYFDPNCDRDDSKCDIHGQLDIQASLEVLACPSNVEEHKRNIKIQVIGTNEALDIELQYICDCKFALNKYPPVANSDLCHNNGTLKLGNCECNKGRVGKTCECSTEVGNVHEDKCKSDPTLMKCNDRGTCMCSTCSCSNHHRYWGDRCECDNEDPACFAPGDTSARICSGNGDCACGVCKCRDNYMGVHCTTYCSPSLDTCRHSFSTQVCSGSKEMCTCGQCRCLGDSVGKYCEQCPDCTHLDTYCRMLHPCVTCHREGGKCSSECKMVAGDVQVPIYNITTVDTDTYTSLDLSEWTECRTLEEGVGCYALFKYRIDGGVYVDVQNKPDCTQQDNILIMVGVSILGAVLIGLFTLLAWKLLTNLHDSREYERFKKEMDAADWGDNENPLYDSPTTTFKNPAFSE